MYGSYCNTSYSNPSNYFLEIEKLEAHHVDFSFAVVFL